MRKLSLILVSLLIITGGVYALVANLFPDTVDFPRIPVAPGTLGYSIATMLWVADLWGYAGDGTVNNTDKLGGVSADNYLKHNQCSVPDVWLGIEPDGTPICGPAGSLLAYEIGTLTGVTGTVTIIKPDGTTNVGSDGDTLYYDDIVMTAASSSGTIAFTDTSIIRLDELTTVELGLSENDDGETIAQVILNDWDLWGRVLTSSGMEFWAGGYIAWVRGTSLAIQKDGMDVTFSFVDSTIDTNNAVRVSYASNPTAYIEVWTWTQITVSSGTYDGTILSTTPGKTSLLANNEWARTNTLSDMEYLLPLTTVTTLNPELSAKIREEFDATTPTLEDTTVCDALGGTTASCSQDASEEFIPTELLGAEWRPLTTAEIEGRKKLKALRMICSYKYGGKFWRTRGQCFVPEPFAGGGKSTTLFLADYVGPQSSNINPFQINIPVFDAINSDPNIIVNGGTVLDPISNAPLIAASPDLKGADMVIQPKLEKLLKDEILQDNGNFKILIEGNPIWWGQIITKNGVSYGKWNISTLLNLLPNENNTADAYYPANNLIAKITSYYTGGYTDILIKNPLASTTTNWGSQWGNTKYSEIYLEKENPITNIPGYGIPITTNWQYISYPVSQLWDLSKKVITIKTMSPLSTGWKRYLLDTGSERFYAVIGWICKSGNAIWNYICRYSIPKWTTDIYKNIETTMTEFSINLDFVDSLSPHPVTTLIIWNVYNNNLYNAPIATAIKSLSISSQN